MDNFKMLVRGFLIILMLLTFSLYSLAQTAIDTGKRNQVAKWYKTGDWLQGCQLKPHNSTNQQAFAKEYFGNKAVWNKTFEWLKSNDLNSLAPGRYVIAEGYSTATISEAPAPVLDDVKWEIHRNYNDLQYIINGKALMGVVPVENATLTEPYDSKRDVGFYEAVGAFYDAVPGTFFIFTPADVHRPGIRADDYNENVKKIVIKIRALN